MFPRKMNREEYAERKLICAEYLSRIARSSENRLVLLVEWAEKIYDTHARGRISLVKSSGDISLLLTELDVYYVGMVRQLLAEACPSDSESDAIKLALGGRASEWLAKATLGLPTEAEEEENSGGVAHGELSGIGEEPVAAQRRAAVDDYIAEVARDKKRRITRTDFWKKAGFRHATEFERWQRNNSRSSKQHDRAFTLVLTEKPHLK